MMYHNLYIIIKSLSINIYYIKYIIEYSFNYINIHYLICLGVYIIYIT